MSVKVSPGGLSGLIVKISDELKDSSIDVILSKYPISKTALPYLLTLQEEYSKMFLDFIKEEYSPLESENNALKKRIKQLESDLERLKGEDTIKEISFLKERVRALEEQVDHLQEENFDLRDKLELFERFINESFLGALLYKRFLNAL